MKIKNRQIVCFGEMLRDKLPGGAKPGGAPMNVAVHLKNFNHHPWFVSRIGNDDNGLELMAFLHQKGMDTSLIQVDETLPTSEVLVSLDREGNAKYEICEPVAWDNVQWTPEVAEASQHAGIIIFGTLAARNSVTRDTLLQILENSAIRILDVNLRPPYDRREVVELLLSKCDFAKLNHEELDVLTGWLSDKILNEEEKLRMVALHYQLPGMCLTRGERGALLWLDEKMYEHPGYRVKVNDTVGAGDAFLAALTDGFIRKLPPDILLARACATGALVASREGATPEYSPDDIEPFNLQQ